MADVIAITSAYTVGILLGIALAACVTQTIDVARQRRAMRRASDAANSRPFRITRKDPHA